MLNMIKTQQKMLRMINRLNRTCFIEHY